jgi:acetyl-CoA carboxylase biotin carboxyl carrier protein
MTKTKEIRELAALMEEMGLSVLEIDNKNDTIRLERATTGTILATPSDTVVGDIQSRVVLGTPVTSPMVGVFYAALAPGAQPYVSVGDHVEKGQVLCIIEAMKLMNEILAETTGTVTEICVDNGQIVEFGEPLMYIS